MENIYLGLVFLVCFWFVFNPLGQSVSLAGVFRPLTLKVTLDILGLMSPFVLTYLD